MTILTQERLSGESYLRLCTTAQSSQIKTQSVSCLRKDCSQRCMQPPQRNNGTTNPPQSTCIFFPRPPPVSVHCELARSTKDPFRAINVVSRVSTGINESVGWQSGVIAQSRRTEQRTFKRKLMVLSTAPMWSCCSMWCSSVGVTKFRTTGDERFRRKTLTIRFGWLLT